MSAGALLVWAGLAQAQPAASGGKRPMTFEDMMGMKRLGETAVSPDGKWVAYSVTTVDLEKNSKTAELWLQKIDGGEPQKLAVGQAGDGGVEFAPDGRSVLFLSGRESGQQVWVADFDTATGTASHAHKLTSISTEADNAKWSPDGRFVVFTSSVYPDCPAIRADDSGAGDRCNADKDKAAAESKVKAQIFTSLLYRHWNHFTGAKRSHLFSVAVDGSALRDLTPGDTHDVPPFSLEGGGGFAIAPDGKELAFTENPDPVPAISTSAQIYTLDLTDASAKPVKVSTSAGGNFTPAYSPDGKYLAWRSQARAGYESDKFRLWLYDRAAKTGRDLLPKWDNWIDEFAWREDSHVIFFTSGDAGEEPIYSLNVVNGETNVRPVQLTDSGEFAGLYPITTTGKKLIATRLGVDEPGEIVALDAAMVGNGAFDVGMSPESPAHVKIVRATAITHLDDALLAELELPKMESFWFVTKDGRRCRAF